MGLDNLVIANIPVDLDGVNTSFLKWPDKDMWFPAETCARHLLLGTPALEAGLLADTILLHEIKNGKARPQRNIPNPLRPHLEIPADFSHTATASDNKRPMLLRGTAAYEFLVRMISGLESNVPAEYHIVDQTKKKLTSLEGDLWLEAELQKELLAAEGLEIPKRAKDLDTPEMATNRVIMRHLSDALTDARIIRGTFYPQYTPSPKPEDSAVKLAGVDPDDSVIVMAGTPEVTAQLVRALSPASGSHSVRKIIVVHPNDYTPQPNGKIILEQCIAEIAKLQDKRPSVLSPKLKIETMLFDTACASGFSAGKHVFVRTAMKPEFLDAYTRMADAWQKRAGNTNGYKSGHIAVLTPSAADNPCTVLWNASGAQGYIPATSIAEHYAAAKHDYEIPLSHAAQACGLVAEARSIGLSSGKIEQIVRAVPLGEDAVRLAMTTAHSEMERSRSVHARSASAAKPPELGMSTDGPGSQHSPSLTSARAAVSRTNAHKASQTPAL